MQQWKTKCASEHGVLYLDCIGCYIVYAEQRVRKRKSALAELKIVNHGDSIYM